MTAQRERETPGQMKIDDSAAKISSQSFQYGQAFHHNSGKFYEVL